jgi:hypothetical protein
MNDLDWEEELCHDTRRSKDVIDLDWRESIFGLRNTPLNLHQNAARNRTGLCTRAQQSLDAECHLQRVSFFS